MPDLSCCVPPSQAAICGLSPIKKMRCGSIVWLPVCPPHTLEWLTRCEGIPSLHFPDFRVAFHANNSSRNVLEAACTRTRMWRKSATGGNFAMRIRFKALVSALVSLLFAAVSFGQGQRQPAADLIVTDAKVWTVDKAGPSAQAVAILGDRIVAVGSNADVDVWRGSQTKVVDAAGKLLLPGFNDAHVHFISGGSQLDNVQLNDAASAEEFTCRIGERAHAILKGQWILPEFIATSRGFSMPRRGPGVLCPAKSAAG